MSFDGVLNQVLKGTAWVSGFLLFFLWALVLISILGRTFGFPAPQWEYQFTEYSLFWATLLLMAWVSRRQRHVTVDVLIALLGPKGQLFLEVFHKIIGSIACLIMTFASGWICWVLYKTNVIEENVIDLPRWAIVSVVPLSFLLFFLEFIYEVFDTVRRYRALRISRQ